MSFELAIRITEILLAFAFIQQSAEHLRAPGGEWHYFLPRILFSLLLFLDFWTSWTCLALLVLSLLILKRFQGPYNGGCDRMSLLILSCLCLVHFMPGAQWQELAFGYLAVQLILSYFIAGFVKIVNPEWRRGKALEDVFRFSAYPVSDTVRRWADHPQILFFMSWAVILFELLFPFTLLTKTTLIIGLVIAAMFHLANACLFGLNRFFWIWLAAYPSILWFQYRLFDMNSLS